jgi:hypothetical protein
MRPRDRHLARRPHDTHALLEVPGTIDLVVTVKLRYDTDGVTVILQLAAPGACGRARGKTQTAVLLTRDKCDLPLNDASELKLRAERRLAELLGETTTQRSRRAWRGRFSFTEPRGTVYRQAVQELLAVAAVGYGCEVRIDMRLGVLDCHRQLSGVHRAARCGSRKGGCKNRDRARGAAVNELRSGARRMLAVTRHGWL